MRIATLWTFVLTTVILAQDRYSALDASRKVWRQTEIDLQAAEKLSSKDAAKLIDRAERDWRAYSGAKRAVYQALLEEAGGAKDRVQSVRAEMDPEATKESLLNRRGALVNRLNLLSGAISRAQAGGPAGQLNLGGLTEEIRLTRETLAALDSAYVLADQAAKGAGQRRETRAALAAAIGELAGIYREQIAAIQAEDAEMQREFMRLRKLRRGGAASQTPEGSVLEADSQQRFRTWTGRSSLGAKMRLAEREGHVVFEVIDGESFQCSLERVTRGTVECAAKSGSTILLTIAPDQGHIDLAWRTEGLSRSGIAPSAARMEPSR